MPTGFGHHPLPAADERGPKINLVHIMPAPAAPAHYKPSVQKWTLHAYSSTRRTQLVPSCIFRRQEGRGDRIGEDMGRQGVRAEAGFVGGWRGALLTHRALLLRKL